LNIDRNLNLVLTVETERGYVYVYSVPLNVQIFERFFMTISKAYVAMVELGGEWLIRMGPRVAKRVLERVAKADGSWEGPDGMERGFMNEIRRTTLVNYVSDNGWDEIPLQLAIDHNILSADDVVEIENAICFFTVVSASETRKKSNALLQVVFGRFGALLTSSTTTELRPTWLTSKTDETTGEKERASSIPH
jgi:hypothetical protein